MTRKRLAKFDDHWRDAAGNRFYYRAGGGVRGDPYVYQWHDPAHCFRALVERLLKTDMLDVEVVLETHFGRMEVRSGQDVSRAEANLLCRSKVRKVTLHFNDHWGCSRAEVSAFGVGRVAECNFNTASEIDDFVADIEAEFVRQKLAAAPKKAISV